MAVTKKLSNVLPTFSIGSTVACYVGITSDAGWPKPSGAAVTTAVVAADGSLTFAGLTARTEYAAGQLQGQSWRFLEFITEVEAHEEAGVKSVNGKSGSVTGIEETANKVQALSGESEIEYPSEKAVQLGLAAKQPLDSDLTAIAGLSTQAFGRALLELASAAAGRTALGLGTAATEPATAFQPKDTDLTEIAALTTVAFGRELLTLASAAAGRTALGLGTAATEPATAFQPKDTDLTEIAALTTVAFGRELLTLANAAALMGKLPEEGVEAKYIKALAVTAAKLAAESVEEGKIKALAVTEGKLGAEAVAEGKIKALAVSAAKLAANAVETAKIASEAVTEEKLASAVKTKLKGAHKEEKTFTWSGEVTTASLEEFRTWLGVASGETKKLVKMTARLASGTKATIKLQRNGADATGFTALGALSTEDKSLTPTAIEVADGDVLKIVVTAVEGTPKGLSVTVYLEVTH